MLKESRSDKKKQEIKRGFVATRALPGLFRPSKKQLPGIKAIKL